MMSLRVVLLALLAVIGLANELHAEAGIEYREKRGILVIEGFEHWVDLRGQFDDHASNTGTGNSRSTTFQELYNVNLLTSIVDPTIFQSTLNGSLGFNQDSFTAAGSDNSSDGVQYQYLFSGSGLKKSKSPFNINSSRQISTSSSPYSPSYTTDSTNNELRVSLFNDILQSKLAITRNTLVNSGGGFDSSTASNSYSYTGENTYGRSTTTLTGAITDTTSSNGPSNSNTFSFANSIGLDPEKKYTLLTNLQVVDSMYTGIPQFTLTFSEGVTTILGPALTFNANYTLIETRTKDYLGQSSDSKGQAADATLSHSLFQSLDTILNGKGSTTDILGGTETKYSGTVRFNYRKILSEQSRMAASISDQYERDDRNVASSLTTVQSQPFTGVHPGDTITLPLSGALLRTIISIRSQFPALTYTEGSDYTVNYSLGIIYILPGGRINNAAGTDLYISYTYFLDPSLQYSDNTFSASTNVILYNGALSFGGSYSGQTYKLITGSIANSLRDSQTIQGYIGSNADVYNYRITFTDNKTGDLHYDTIEGNGQYYWREWSLTGLERYAMYDSSLSGPGYTENTTQFTLTYSRPFADFILFSSTANLMDERNSLRKTNDYATLRTSVKLMLNKLTISFTGQTGWQFSGSTITRNDAANVNLTRYF